MAPVAQDVEVDVVPVHEASDFVTALVPTTVLVPTTDITMALDTEAGVHGLAAGPLGA
jgi:hypothetical protein